MGEASSWAFDLSQYGQVWQIMINIGLALILLLFGNIIRRTVPFLRKLYIPSALLGGLFLFLLELILSACSANTITIGEVSYNFIDKRIMQIITYHALAVGFIAMTLKMADKDHGVSIFKSIQNGAMTGATYMLQAVVGIGVSLIFFFIGWEKFYATGALLPLGFGQGPGNALSWDITFTNMGVGFHGNGSVGLTIASIGFVVACVVGVIYINIFRHKGEITHKEKVVNRDVREFELENEIEDNDSVDKMSIQVAFVALGYAIAFLIMFFFSGLSSWTGIALFNSVAWGFNFIWGVIAAVLMKIVINLLRKKNIMHHRYINNYQMDRISGFAFDLMIVAGVGAIDISVVADYIWIILALSLVGTIATIVYIRVMSKMLFKNHQHEAFLVNFGTLTGTASNGMILLREVDPNFETPMASIFIVSQLPATLFVAPLLVLLELSGKSLTGCIIAVSIFAGLFILYTTFLVLSYKGIIFKKYQENA